MKPHIAFLPSPGMGNFTPLFEFAKRLVIHHGFHVSFLVITTGASAAQHHLIQSPPPPPDLHVIHLPLVQHIPATFTDDMLVLTRLCLIIEESIKPLRSMLLNLTRPKLLVIDMFCTQAFAVCKELSIPVYSFFTASTALLAFSLYLPTLDREVEGEYVDLPDPIQVPGCNPIHSKDLLDQVKNRKNDEYKWYLLHVSRLTMSAGIFVNTWEDFEPVWLQGLKNDPFYTKNGIPPVHLIGPLIKQDEPVSESDEKIQKWLDNQPVNSVLFVALGSGGTLTSDQLTELAWGLELSQQRFIFVMREPTDANASASFFNVGNDVIDPVGVFATRVCGSDGESRASGAVLGPTGGSAPPQGHRRVLVTLRVEIHVGEHGAWRADDCMATLRRAEDECGGADGGGGGGGEHGRIHSLAYLGKCPGSRRKSRNTFSLQASKNIPKWPGSRGGSAKYTHRSGFQLRNKRR